MSFIFDGNQGDDESTYVKDGILDAVRTVDFAQLANYLGCTWNKERTCITCPNMHNGRVERNPSLHVYPHDAYCFTCSNYYGPVDLVMATLGVTFFEALEWFRENAHLVPDADTTQVVHNKAVYKGPAPRELVEYWHTCLTSETREWLHQRLILDRTIDRLKIGWRPDFKAYTIPFWRGIPGESEIDIIQYRYLEGERRWRGMTGYNRPSVINSHMIGKHSLVLLFGTFDAVLAAQDGLAAVSTNGATMFMRDEENIDRLRAITRGCKVYVVPDKQDVEAKPAYVLAHHLRAEVRHFPKEMVGKDYTDYRMSGKTPGHFIQEVLMIGEGFIQAEHDDLFTDLLYTMSQDMWDSVETILFSLQSIYPDSRIVNQHIQLRMQFDPFPEITHEQWDELRELIAECTDWSGLFMWGKQGTDMAHANRGGF